MAVSSAIKTIDVREIAAHLRFEISLDHATTKNPASDAELRETAGYVVWESEDIHG